ncbi:glycosyltransferase family 10 domain-containing protein [Aestuariivita boseongensis]|uniref:glycosyltransferase family 10 domain-containing protein n=1 Tax=Aestuariivita boseongensis TaxID=1470562 RepID=UPI0006819450|nr:glycosyltransferase family 10 [Aestuariivita boseongensis]
MSDPAIAVVPYGTFLGPKQAKLPLNALNWPLGQPERLKGGVLGDLTRSDHLIVYPKTKLHYLPSFGTRARISWVMGEPAIWHAKHIRLLKYTWRRFHRIFTFHQELLDRLPNARLMPYATTWVPNWRDLDFTKTRHMSLIASGKNHAPGHTLRHEMVTRSRAAGLDVDVMGHGYAPFEKKSDGLAPYKFSVVIENVQQKNYFTEKLLDAVLCDTVPIYWGCPNLEEFCDTSGIIRCNTEAELWAAIETASDAIYQERLPHLQAIKPAMDALGDLEKRAAQAILDEL